LKIEIVPQQSIEWWKLKVGKVSGTRFGKIISGKKNRLIYELMNEVISGKCEQDEYLSDEMQYGVDNEDIALEMYSQQTGVKIYKVGAIMSDICEISMASPDALSTDNTIAQEVKCTMHGYIHIQRIFEGPESTYLPQIINYFVVDDIIEHVDFISYCGFREERPLYHKRFSRSDFTDKIELGRKKLFDIQEELKSKLEEYHF
jgi:hypothetical protein